MARRSASSNLPPRTPWTRQPSQAVYGAAVIRRLRDTVMSGPDFQGAGAIAASLDQAAAGYAARQYREAGVALAEASAAIARLQSRYEAELAGGSGSPYLRGVARHLAGLSAHAQELCITTGPSGPHRHLPGHAGECISLARRLRIARPGGWPEDAELAQASLTKASKELDAGQPDQAYPLLDDAVLCFGRLKSAAARLADEQNGHGKANAASVVLRKLSALEQDARSLRDRVQATYQPRDADGNLLMPDDTVTVAESPGTGPPATVSFTHGALVTLQSSGHPELGSFVTEASRVRRTVRQHSPAGKPTPGVS